MADTTDVSGLVRRVTTQDFVPLHQITGDQREQGSVATLISREFGGSTDIMLGLARFGPGESRRPHHHPNASEAYVVLRGEVVIHVGGDDVSASYGTAVYVPPNTVHSIRNDSDQPAEVLWAFNHPERSDHGLVYDDHVWPELA
ncbi:MAG TPA: dimethylsulfonioproprionate lyase family protein [Micromonosporaceae bacterium]